MAESMWIEEARAMAAQCWCDPETSDREMDVVLAEAVAQRIAGWMDTAAQYARNEDYYRGLLDACAPVLGEAVFIADDGSRSDEPLRAKIPELVAKLAELHR
jgi:hypothetical protein